MFKEIKHVYQSNSLKVIDPRTYRLNVRVHKFRLRMEAATVMLSFVLVYSLSEDRENNTTLDNVHNSRLRKN